MTLSEDSLLQDEEIVLQSPTLQDGLAVNQLIQACPPLDTNSSYCNFLQCSYFSSTSVIAKCQGKVVGFVSGFWAPDHPQSLFIWQVAVSETARGQGLASRMVSHLRSTLTPNYLHTTIGPSNRASWALFERLSSEWQTPLSKQSWLEADAFEGNHEAECLVTLGPLNRSE